MKSNMWAHNGRMWSVRTREERPWLEHNVMLVYRRDDWRWVALDIGFDNLDDALAYLHFQDVLEAA